MGKPLILLTGATGYVGGRLKAKLEEAGYPLRLLVRSERGERGTAEVVVGDALDKKVLQRALEGVQVAFYFIHSMNSASDFAEEDRLIAKRFAEAASKANVQRIIYLGGLGSHYDALSPHLSSRHEVGEILRANSDGVQVIEFRASIVIGSGSLSFELVRSLTEKLPLMITPKWVWTKAQPIAVADLLNYLMQAIDMKIEGNPIFEIGGKDQVSYGELMREYAAEKGLKRWMVPVPVLSPRLSSLWLGLVTPVYARVGKKLVESAVNETIVHDPLALKLFSVKPMGYREAIREALRNEGECLPLTRWNDAVSSALRPKSWSREELGERFSDEREVELQVPQHKAFQAVEEIGGQRGYYFGNWLWQLRGILDLLVGGVGYRRFRRDPFHLKVGDVVDFWRVEEIKRPSFLKLRAEMKLPGRAWLEFQLDPKGEGTKIVQRALFDPAGVFGIAYWYCLYPLHHVVFNGMLNGMKKWILQSQDRRD